MNKYIRTKDGIYEIESDYLNNKGVRVGYNVVGQEEVVLIENNNIIQADTIEELCDGYYLYNGYDDKFNPDRIYTTDEKTKALDDCKDLAFHIDLMCKGRYICELRAFIETDKGLIFIGKFNENGKLVLI